MARANWRGRWWIAGCLASLALGALPAGSAAAETGPADAAGSEPEAPAAPSPPTLQTPPVLVGGVRPATLPEDPTSFTSIIDVDRFEGEAKTLTDIVSESVGVQVRRFGGPGDASEISIRGSSANQVVVLLDGVRLNTAQTGTVDLSTIPRDLVERIEISRGGGSVQTGSDAIGGVVNIITRRPSGDARTNATFSGGSWNTFDGSLSHTGTLAGLETSLGYDGFGTDGNWQFQSADRRIDGELVPGPPGDFTRVNNDSQRHAALLRLARDVGEKVRVRFTDDFVYEAGGEPGPDSGGGALLGQSTTARSKRLRNLTDLHLGFADAGAWGLSGDTRLYYRFDRSRFDDPQPVLGAPVDSDDRNHSLGGRGELRRSFGAGWSEHRGSLGLETRGDWLVSDAFDDQSRFVVGAFGQDEIRLLEGAVRAVPALRFDYTEGFGGTWIPRFGLILRPAAWLELKGNVERAYRVPNFDELYFDREFVRGNPNLEPEDALDADVGLRLSLARLGPATGAWLELAFFRNDVHESIVFQPVSQFVVAATNTGPALVKGLELAGGLRLLRWAGLEANWTHLSSEARRTGQPLPGRADDEVLVRLSVGPESGLFKLVGECQYVSDLPVTADGGTTVSARTVWNASAVLDLHQLPLVRDHVPGQRLLLSLTADNLTDVSVRDAQFFPQPGRWLTLRVEWQL